MLWHSKLVCEYEVQKQQIMCVLCGAKPDAAFITVPIEILGPSSHSIEMVFFSAPLVLFTIIQHM